MAREFKVGVGDSYARARLLLAKRAGYLPGNFVVMPKPGQASQQWRQVSKNLASDARRHGFDRPTLWLRQSAAQGGLAKASGRRAGLRVPGEEALDPSAENPDQLNIASIAPMLRAGFNPLMSLLPQEDDPQAALLAALMMRRGV